ncbi:enoyl-CoA hydratase-related protein [Caldibacillus debilis]|uniref:Enoyl-CoA hydratase/carnithine racemase n=1 Tax=Caldibacillus debilis GB1 TaxID=1339248 RepID=A0A420VK70_9BACI|nr:enoyl-CoA hydratase-related protein [Caldibacillus debilis]RKO63753.1 Enoyl-CoA hydratase/carnithine racemase [Caldibacillus debilis GB1]
MAAVGLDIQNQIAVVTLNRPETLNALNFGMLEELERTVERLRYDRNVRIVIFTGAGEKAFSAGADLKERKNLTDDEVRRNVNKTRTLFQRISELPKPTIAAVNGYAFGGGFELMLACDLRIAAKTAVMGLTETSLAIIPGAGGTQRLPRLIGEARAKELIFAARKITAEEAYLYGILNKIAEPDELMDVCFRLAGEILQNGPLAVQQAKMAIRLGMDVDLKTGLAIEEEAYEKVLATKDRIEALRAFAEKRKPNFSGE